MSLMRKALLAGSTSPWLREQATKRAFIRKSVSRFMPGETIDEALLAAKTLQPERITTILTRLGENLTKLDEAEEVTAHYLDVLDSREAAGPRRADLREAHAARSRSRRRASVSATSIASSTHAEQARQHTGLDRHGELAIRRPDA